MNMGIFSQLLSNAGLLLSVSVLNQLGHLIYKKRGRWTPYLDGFLLGIIGVTVMINPMVFSEGLVFDTRSILLSVGALYLGPIPAIIAALMTAAYRISMGGVGTLPGVLVILSTTAFGLWWRLRYPVKKIRRSAWNLYQFGFATHLIMILCMFSLPWDLALSTVKNIASPVLALYPFASLLLSALIQTQEENQFHYKQILESESLYRSFFENNQAVVMIVDPEFGSIYDANQSASQYYGYPLETLRSMKINQINLLTQEQILERMALSVDKKQNHFEFEHRLANGEIRDVEVYSGPVSIEGKKMLYSIIHDITERVKAEKSLAESEIRFRSLVENAPYAIFIQFDLKFYYLNRTACQLFGVNQAEDLIGQPVMDHFHPDYRARIEERIRQLNEEQHIVPSVDEVFLKVDNSPVDVRVIAVPYKLNQKNGALVFALDISDEKKLERQKEEFEVKIRQQQKLEAIGQLAGGVAHEINNPINGIMNYAQLIVDSVKETQEVETYAKEIIRETDRVSGIVKNLLQFARMEKQSHSYSNFYDIVDRTVSLTKVILNKDNIRLNIHLDENLPILKCRSQQIQQVLMNLLTNARDALNDRYPSTDPQKIIDLGAHEFIKDGRRWIQLDVTDYGIGIDPSIAEKIFEPFYSTKSKEKGTGLGLAISYGIIKDHHGEILVDSVLNDHTTMSVILPVDNGWDITEVKHD